MSQLNDLMKHCIKENLEVSTRLEHKRLDGKWRVLTSGAPGDDLERNQNYRIAVQIRHVSADKLRFLQAQVNVHPGPNVTLYADDKYAEVVPWRATVPADLDPDEKTAVFHVHFRTKVDQPAEALDRVAQADLIATIVPRTRVRELNVDWPF